MLIKHAGTVNSLLSNRLDQYILFSKPLTYAIALNELGSEVVHQYVGQEPSGRMFNELILDYNSKSRHSSSYRIFFYYFNHTAALS